MIETATVRLLIAWQSFTARFKDDEGQTLAEYGLIMSVIAVAVVVLGVVAFRSAIVSSFNDSSSCLDGLGSCAY